MAQLNDLYTIYKNNPVISTDSRNIIPGSIFFALKGPAFNGNAFAEMALEKGAAFSVIDEPEYRKNEKYILTGDVLKTLQELANHHRRQLKIPFLAITGSNGKTTSKELVSKVLSKKYRTVATKGNLNNHIGVPLTLLSIGFDAEFAVVEMGANHQLEIDSYCLIAEPDYGLITNIGKAHLEGFGGMEGIRKGKGELYEWVSKNGKGIFQNGNNAELISMSDKFNFSKIIRYGTGTGLYCTGEIVNEQPFLSINWKCENRSGKINSKLVGVYNFENILSAICIGNYFNVTPEDIDEAIGDYQPDNSRSQVVTKGSNIVILDAYNANPTSMEAALRNFEKISGDHKIVFIGDMAELGDESFDEHLRIASLLNKLHFDKIILVGKNFEQFVSGLKNGIHFPDSEKAFSWLKENPVRQNHILIKGSRSMKMEKIMEAL